MQSLDIPQGPRNPNGYSKEEILRALRGIDGSRRWTFRYELLDLNNEKIMDLDEHVLSCTISQNFLAQIKRTATFELKSTGEINFLNDRIKPYARLHMPTTIIEEHETFQSFYYNNFNGTDGATASTANSTEHGDKFIVGDEVSFVPRYEADQAVGGGSSLYFPGVNQVYTEPVLTPGENQETYYRVYFYIPTNGGIRISARSANATPSAQSLTEVLIRDDTNVFVLGGQLFENIDISSIAANLVGQWVRVDMLSSIADSTRTWRFFWTNIHGTTPDFSHTATIDSSLNSPSAGVYLYAPTSNGAYIDNMEFGNYSIISESVATGEDNYVEWPLGVFLLSSPTKETDENGVVTRAIEAYDGSKIFQDDKVEDRYTVRKGDKYIDHINALLGNVPKIVAPDSTLAARDREWPIGTEKENIINDITQFINYESLTFDEDGRAVIRPYILPDLRTPEYEYADDEISVMYPSMSQELDLFDVANKWVLVVSNPEQEPMKAVLENNDPADPTSIVRRGRVIVDFREETDVADQGSLTKKIRRLAYEAGRQFEAVEFKTAIMPIHSFNDVYTIKYSPLAINEKYTEHTWEMPLEPGAEMEHRARRVVKLNPASDEAFIEDDLTITGTLTAGNIAHGRVTVTNKGNGVPSLATVSGLNLKGNGKVFAQVTPLAGSPNVVKTCTIFGESPTGMRIWLTRTDTTGATTVMWFMMRDL